MCLQTGGTPGQGTLGCLCMTLMPSHPKLVLLPPWHPPAPCTPKRAGCLLAGRWVVASPLCDSSGPGRGRDGLLIEGYSASHRAQKCHLPPQPHARPSPHAPHTGPDCRGWDGSRPVGHIVGPSWGRGRESLSVSPLGWQWWQCILQGPRRYRDVSPHLAQAGGFSWLHAQAHRVAAAWPRSAQGPLATGPVCWGCWGACAGLL